MSSAIRKISDTYGIFHYVESINTPDYPSEDWEHNPDVSGVSGVTQNYWKYDGSSVVVEMSQAEKDAVDAAILEAGAHINEQSHWNFIAHGRARNKWLSLSSGSHRPSLWNPAICLDAGRISGLAFVNEKNSVSTDVEIYKNGIKIFTWSITDKRWATKTTGLSNVTFDQGDKISVLMRDTGTDPRYPMVSVYYQLTNSVPSDGGSSTL